MDDHSPDPATRYTRPTPRPYARPRPSLSRYLLATAAVAVIAALVLWGGLSAQVAAGNDPVLGNKGSRSATTVSSASTSTATSGDGDDGLVLEQTPSGGVVVVGAARPQTSAPAVTQAPTPTPVQTTTS